MNFLESLYERFATAGVDVLEGGMLEDAADEYLATRNIKDRHSTSYDSIQIYLREIGQYPLLTDKQEVELAQAIEAGERAKARIAKEAHRLSQRMMELQREMGRKGEKETGQAHE